MSELNKTLRIRTAVGAESAPVVNVSLEQDYDTFEIMSLKLSQKDTYKLHNANYGVVVGRVIANGGFGVPNAKISVFIEGEFDSSVTDDVASIYPYTSTRSKDGDGIRYNLLPDNKVDDCHQVVGTFPNKSYLLDNDVLIEVFDKYFKYTTRTNNAGDYIICGVPTGSQTIHMDLDLSDCGILSQRPRDFVYKGYTIEQFENPNQFKTSTSLDSLSQIFSQDKVVNVVPFWGNESLGETIGITRADIEISFKFEPTCVFMGCVVGDNASNGISKKCVPTNQMGAMDELTTGEGTIEMIRKTVGGDIEEFQVKGNQVIDGNGVWCYQIPMNLDYMMTDEYGNMVATDDPDKGIPTRTRVRFRVSMQDFETNTDNFFRAKVLVPHNPQDYVGEAGGHEDYDYEFGSQTREESFRDLFWNNVYTVKSYVPRFQKSQVAKTERFSGIKHCNIYGQNNPMPYNNIRIRLPFMFTLLCVLIKTYIRIIYITNSIWNVMVKFFAKMGSILLWVNGIANALIAPINWLIKVAKKLGFKAKTVRFTAGERFLDTLSGFRYVSLAEGLCPDLDNWYFAPVNKNLKGNTNGHPYNLLQQTFEYLLNNGEDSSDTIDDPNSIDKENTDPNEEAVCLTIHTDYLVACIEMNLAQEYKVINFDFYNDWVNGVIYMPRWMRIVKKKKKHLFGLIKAKTKVKACMDNSKIFGKTRRYTQQCALSYKINENKPYTQVTTDAGCTNTKKGQKCHKKNGKKHYFIFGSGKKKRGGNGGIVHEDMTSDEKFVYYFKPCEWSIATEKKVNLFANDLVLLGSLNNCNLYGIPQAFKYLTSSSYVMPTNLALTNMDDDGYLYADDSGTACSTNKNLNDDTNTDSNANKKLEQVDTTFEKTSNYYAASTEDLKYGTDDYNDDANYDDTIPITEAAGIAWNYAGPGQGKNSKSKKKLYYPGGHFLGLSCVKSQTNIKSCVNLQRICEAGTNMSQRREELKNISIDNNENITLKYNYYVPTGLIAEEDISASDFRSMFATMNYNRLLCTGNTIDEKTGYPLYDFTYLRGTGFDGALNNKIKSSEEYNKRLSAAEVGDESQFIKSEGGNLSDDYDVNEMGSTYRRTIEVANKDYYMFRMGLKNLSTNEQNKRFLFTNNGASLPQYENSYYFYFGLKDGATALDEFTKQFFSTCATNNIVANEPEVKITVDIDACKLMGDLTINTKFLVMPLTVRIVDSINGNTILKTTSSNYNVIPNDEVPIPSLNFGTYEVTVTDANETEITKTVKVGDRAITLGAEGHAFEFRTSEKPSDYEGNMRKGKNSNSGYIAFDKLTTIKNDTDTTTGHTIGDGKVALCIVRVNEDGDAQEYVLVGGGVVPTGIGGKQLKAFTADTGDKINVYCWSSDANYDIYYEHRCAGGDWSTIYLRTISLAGINKYDLYLGSKYFPYSTKLYSHTYGWWNKIYGQTLDNWAYRHYLFRQLSDDTEEFSNQVIALNARGKVIDTALFGAPEKVGGALKDVYYEGDDDYFNTGNDVYSLDDESIIPTWKWENGILVDGGEVGNTWVGGRRHFGEMALNGNLIVSDKYNETSGTITVNGNKIVFQADDTTVPHTITQDYGAILKFTNGEIAYARYEGGGAYTYYGDTPDTDRATAGIYPVFTYPVMYRPFYSEVTWIDWVVPDAEVGNDDEEAFPAETTFHGWKMEGETYHGNTYPFSGFSYHLGEESKINGITCVEAEADNRNRYNNTDKEDRGDFQPQLLKFHRDENDLVDTPTIKYELLFDKETINNNNNTRAYLSGWTDGDEYSYELYEGHPETIPDEMNSPNKLELAVSEGVIDPSSLPTTIYYKEGGSNMKYFSSDIKGNDCKYRIVNMPSCELKEEGYLWCVIDDTIYLAAHYNERANAKSKKNVIGDRVYIEMSDKWFSNKYRYEIYTSDTATTPTLREERLGHKIPNNYKDSKIQKWLKTGAMKDWIKTWDADGVTVDKKYDFEDTTSVTVKDYLRAFSAGTEITLDELGYSTIIDDKSLVLGIKEEKNAKETARIIRLYKNLMKLGRWDASGETQTCHIEHTNTSNQTYVFGNGGGSGVGIKVVSNVDNEWTIELDGKSWLKFADTDSTTISGVGSKILYVITNANSGKTVENAVADMTKGYLPHMSGDTQDPLANEYKILKWSLNDGPDTPSGSTKTFTVSPSSKNVGVDGETFKARVTISGFDNNEWSIENNSIWVSTSPAYRGDGSGDVEINVAKNEDGVDRTATIKFYAGAGTAEATLTIKQSAGEPEPETKTFTVKPLNKEVGADGETFTASVKISGFESNTWHLKSNNNWISTDPLSEWSGDRDVTVTVSNNTGATRTGTVSFWTDDGTIERTLTITQLAYVPPETGGTGTFEVYGTDYELIADSRNGQSGDEGYEQQSATTSVSIYLPTASQIEITLPKFNVTDVHIEEGGSPCYFQNGAYVTIDGMRGVKAAAESTEEGPTPFDTTIKLSNVTEGDYTFNFNYQTSAEGQNRATAYIRAAGNCNGKLTYEYIK